MFLLLLSSHLEDLLNNMHSFKKGVLDFLYLGSEKPTCLWEEEKTPPSFFDVKTSGF